MGLDDFASDSGSDDNDEQSSSSSSSSTNTQTSKGGASGQITDPVEESDMTFYGSGEEEPGTRPMERKGAMSNHSVSDLARTTEGDIVIQEDNLKFHLPIFTIITSEKEYESGERYSLKHDKDQPKASWNGKVVVCMSSIETTLGSMNKEVAMFEAGSPSKKRVMQNINSKLGDEVDGNTTIHLNYFGDVFHLRDLAQANEQFRAGELIDRGKIVGKVIKPKELRVALEQRSDEE